jgi:mannose-1-phosphate guanylyltransferase
MGEISNNLWGIILAGGEGLRLRNLTRQIYGYDRPKQYCTFVGTRSLLRHTIDRTSMIISPRKIKLVVNRVHSDFLHDELEGLHQIDLLEQPIPKETGAGILLPMMKVFHEDQNSTVALFPSDHYILGERKFMEYVQKASTFVNENPQKIVMLGIHTDKSESGYGWIEPEKQIEVSNNSRYYSVKKFWEKPSQTVTRFLVDKGCLVNTFVLVGKSKTFLHYANRNMPDLFKAFQPIRSNFGTPQEKIMINRVFKYLPSYNFSKSVLENISRALVVLEVNDVYWSDWGEEERVFQDLENVFTKIQQPIKHPTYQVPSVVPQTYFVRRNSVLF